MFEKIVNFIKYNNATILVLAIIFVLGGSVFASETGREAIGGSNTYIEGVDNTVLLMADLENFNMDFTIENIKEDDKYYYVRYTFLDLENLNNLWQFQFEEKLKKVSKKSGKDMGIYLAEEFKEEYDARIKYLKEEQEKANQDGPEIRTEVTEYTGLIGKTLDLAGKTFPGYEPVKKIKLPTPDFSLLVESFDNSPIEPSTVDTLEDVYNNYIIEHDPDEDNYFDEYDNCPLIYNPDQKDIDGDGLGNSCDDKNDLLTEEEAAEDDLENLTETTIPVEDDESVFVEPESVEVVDLNEIIEEENDMTEIDQAEVDTSETIESEPVVEEPEVVEVEEEPVVEPSDDLTTEEPTE